MELNIDKHKKSLGDSLVLSEQLTKLSTEGSLDMMKVEVEGLQHQTGELEIKLGQRKGYIQVKEVTFS